MRPLSSRAFNQRRDGLLARLDRLGRAHVHDLASTRPVRQLIADVLAPGQPDELGLPDEARFRYQEWWHRSRLGWVRVRYDYDFLDLLRGGRRGYHLHPLAPGSEAVSHAVCVRPEGTGIGHHYLAHEVDLLAAHDEFEHQYAAGRPISCTGLTPID